MEAIINNFFWYATSDPSIFFCLFLSLFWFTIYFSYSMRSEVTMYKFQIFALYLISQAVYTVLREAEDRSVSPIPVWDLPIWKDISPRQRKVTAALKLVNDTLNNLIAICKVILPLQWQKKHAFILKIGSSKTCMQYVIQVQQGTSKYWYGAYICWTCYNYKFILSSRTFALYLTPSSKLQYRLWYKYRF
jgi:hypothetical protein